VYSEEHLISSPGRYHALHNEYDNSLFSEMWNGNNLQDLVRGCRQVIVQPRVQVIAQFDLWNLIQSFASNMKNLFI